MNYALIDVVLPSMMALTIINAIVFFRLMWFKDACVRTSHHVGVRVMDAITALFVTHFMFFIVVGVVYMAQNSGRVVDVGKFNVLTIGIMLLVGIWIFWRTDSHG